MNDTDRQRYEPNRIYVPIDYTVHTQPDPAESSTHFGSEDETKPPMTERDRLFLRLIVGGVLIFWIAGGALLAVAMGWVRL